MTKFEVLDDITMFSTIGINWDGFGGYAPSEKCVINTLKIIGTLDNNLTNKVTNYFPNPHGTISVEFKDYLLMMEVGDSTFTWFTDKLIHKHDQVEITEENLKELIRVLNTI